MSKRFTDPTNTTSITREFFTDCGLEPSKVTELVDDHGYDCMKTMLSMESLPQEQDANFWKHLTEDEQIKVQDGLDRHPLRAESLRQAQAIRRISKQHDAVQDLQYRGAVFRCVCGEVGWKGCSCLKTDPKCWQVPGKDFCSCGAGYRDCTCGYYHR